jgi:hypothetical protein
MRDPLEPTERGSPVPSRATIVLVVFLGIGVFFLITEHTAHVFGVLPYALLLLCPFLHFFMHGGHGHQQGETAGSSAHPLVEDKR